MKKKKTERLDDLEFRAKRQYGHRNVYASFCGTGKTYLCKKFPKKCIEFECWKYTDGDFPQNYIKDIRAKMGKSKYIFISTNPVVLKQLNKLGISIILIYPKNNLKKKYIKGFKSRGSSKDFINMLDKNWDKWLDELKKQDYCKHIVLNDGQYLENLLTP